MKLFIFTFFTASLITTAVFVIAKALSAQSNQDREKLSPFECGFDPKNSARMPFSLRFFLLAVIFLVFDIEIALLMPLPFALSNANPTAPVLIALIFFLILLLGILHEWREGSLDWSH